MNEQEERDVLQNLQSLAYKIHNRDVEILRLRAKNEELEARVRALANTNEFFKMFGYTPMGRWLVDRTN